MRVPCFLGRNARNLRLRAVIARAEGHRHQAPAPSAPPLRPGFSFPGPALSGEQVT